MSVLDLEDETVVVRDLADARALDREVHLADGAEERVDRDHADGETLTPLSGVEAFALLDRELHPERSLGLERGDLDLGVDELDLGGRRDIAGRRGTRAFLLQGEGDRFVRERAQADVFEVEDDLNDVFLDARDRRELVRDAAHPGGRDRRSLERGQQHATQRVAERRAVSRRQRLARELRVAVVAFDALDLGVLEFNQCHWAVPSCRLA